MASNLTTSRMANADNRRRGRSSSDRQSEIPLIEFDRHKYGRHLLVDVCPLEALPGFITTTRAHRLRFYEIVLLTGGSGFLDIDGVSTEIRPGSLCFTASGQVRQWRLDAALKGFVALFEGDFIHEFFADARFLDKLHFFSPGLTHGSLDLDRPTFERLSGIFCAMHVELHAPGDDSTHMLRAHLYRLLVEVQRLRTPQNIGPGGGHRVVHKRFLALVEEHFRTVQQVGQYADLLGVSPSYLNHAARCATGATASDTIHQRIFLEARRLLLYANLSVATIATTLGFSDASYFNRFFNRYAGVAPGAFRDRYEKSSPLREK